MRAHPGRRAAQRSLQGRGAADVRRGPFEPARVAPGTRQTAAHGGARFRTYRSFVTLSDKFLRRARAVAPPRVLVQPSTKGLMTPPISPRLLMKAIPPAAAAPLR